MIIKPASELRNKFREISELTKAGETIFLTRNGSGDMVVMSQDSYDRILDMLSLYKHLADGERDVREGRVHTSAEVYSEIQDALKAKKQ